MNLIEKIRAAREQKVSIGKGTFTIRRPTDEEAIQFSRDDVGLVEIVKRFTTGWNLQEIDLIPGGSPTDIPFDGALFSEWVADQPEVWEPLGQAVLNAYRAHTEKRDTAEKN